MSSSSGRLPHLLPGTRVTSYLHPLATHALKSPSPAERSEGIQGEGDLGGEGPRRSIWSAEHLRRLVVSEDLLRFRVPPQLVPAQKHRYIAKMRDRDGTVSGLDGRGWLLARKDAVDEVAEVVIALIQVDFV